MIKNYIYIASILLIYLSAFSQENAYSSFDASLRNSIKFNRFLINPAFSYAKETGPSITLANRRQWVKFENSPQLYFANYLGRIGNESRMGVGVYQQNVGLLKNFGGVINYSKNVQLGLESNLTFGLNTYIYNSTFDFAKIVTAESEPLLLNQKANSLVGLKPGINLGTEMFDFGIAANNLVLYNITTSEMVKNNQQNSFLGYVMYTGYVNSYNSLFDEAKFTSLFLVEKYKDATAISGNLLFEIANTTWVKGGYNTLYGFSAGVGLTLSEKFSVGYTYDLGLGDISQLGASHEFLLSYRFDDYEERHRYYKKAPKKAKPTTKTTTKPVEPKKSKEQIAQEKADKLALLKSEKAKKAEEAAKKNKNTNVDKNKSALKAEKDKLAAEEAARKKAASDLALKAKAEKDKLASEEAARKAQDEKDKLAADAAARKSQAEKDKLEAEEAARKAQADKDKLEADAAARKAQTEKDKLAAEEAARKAQAEKDKLSADAAARKAQAEKDKLAADAAARKAQAEKDKLASEEAARKAKSEKDKLASEEAARKAQAEKDKLAAEEAARKAKSEKDKLAAEEAARKAQAEKDKLAAEEAARKAKSEKDKQAAEEAARKAQADKDKLAAEEAARKKAATEISEKLLKDESNKAVEAFKKDIELKTKRTDKLTTSLDSIVKSRDLDLKEYLLENTLNSDGTPRAQRKFVSTAEANQQLENLKSKINSNKLEFDKLISDFETTNNQRVNELKLKGISDLEAKPLNDSYLKTLNDLKLKRAAFVRMEANADIKIQQIKEEKEAERLRRIKKAEFDSEKDRNIKDQQILENLKKNQGTVNNNTGNNPKEKQPVNNANSVTDIPIIKKLEDVSSGYYLVLETFRNIDDTKAYLSTILKAGAQNVNFFYNIHNSTYYVYSETAETMGEAYQALKVKGTKTYNQNMIIVKVE